MSVAEVYIVEFPCGTIRCVRTVDVAISDAKAMVKAGACCVKGHATFEVFVFVKSARVASCYAPERAKRALRLVKR